jgi:class 3 adenylate cyclase/tetratricopeptide (TPR) repeat protein
MSGEQGGDPTRLPSSEHEDSDFDFGDSFLEEFAEEFELLPRPSLGEWLGGEDGRRFHVLSSLGKGGMGVVLQARDERLHRTVALKFLPPSAGNVEASLLRQEARAIAQLDHENIIRIFDVAEWRAPGNVRVPYLVMECLDGESLAALLQRERPSLQRALAITSAIAQGLAHAHARHVIHRDLKPSNVFLTREGKVKLLDFGLAYLTATPSKSLLYLPTAGTPGYMAPEQWRGELQDERTDIWAAGLLLYEMLAGHIPYPPDSLEALRAEVLSPAPVPSIRERCPELPEAVERVLSKALAKDPARRFRSAAELREQVDELAGSLGPRAPPVAPQHRQVTLVACQLARLSGHLDEDGLSELASAFQEGATRLFSRYGCLLTLELGDQVLACFGYPVAHEDDSERAVRAGLELTRALPASLQQSLPHLPIRELAVQVGIHTGPALLDGRDSQRTGAPAISGEAPKIATWLAGQAPPRGVLLSDTTWALVRGSFETEPLGARDFEGLASTTHLGLHRLHRERKARLRFDRQRLASALSPLVGRDQELKQLLELWAQARRGRGACVLLQGEAGIGKSRLLQELCSQVGESPHLRLRCQCWPQFSHSAYAPVIEQLRRFLELELEEPPESKLRKLEERLGPLGLLPEHMELIALFLSLPIAEDSPLLLLTPDRRKEKTFEAITALLLRLAAERPILLVVEDLHWADHSTLELLGFVLERIRASRVLIALSARPEFHPVWPPRPLFHTLVLERLSPGQTATLAREVAQGQKLPEQTLAQVAERTDGIPLFVEELTRMVLAQADSGEPHAGQAPSIPITLHELLLARLDQLSPRQKGLAQLCAVVGRSFPLGLLAQVSGRDEASLGQELSALVEAGLLKQERAPEPQYQFRHALIQDAAYQSLPRSRRRQHHRRIAQLLEERFPQIVQERPELLAHHYTEGGEAEPAILYWTRAGEHAARRSAYVDAIGQLEQGLRLLQSLPDPARHAAEELRLRIDMGSPLVELRGYASPEVEQTYARALELFRQVGDELPRLKLSSWGPYSYYYARGMYRVACEIGARITALGHSQHNPEFLALGHRLMTAVRFIQGDLLEAREQLEQAFEACSVLSLEQRRSLAVKHWLDPSATAQAYASAVYALLGRPELARQHIQEAQRQAEELGHPFTSAFVMTHVALASQLLGDAQGVLEWSTRAIALSQEHRFRLWLGWSTILRAWATAELGQWQEGLRIIRGALEQWQRQGMQAGLPHHLAMVADICLKHGQLQEGLEAVKEALGWVERLEERVYEAELYRLQGELLREAGREPEAFRCFQRAMDSARQSGARALEIRAAVSLSHLLEAQGLAEEAHRLLGRFQAEGGLGAPLPG